MTSIPPKQPSGLVNLLDNQSKYLMAFLDRIGAVSLLTVNATRTLLTTRFELRAFIYQLEQLGVKSLGIGAATSVFVGIVMAIQFAFSLEKFGAKDSVGRIVGLSEARELAPALTALVVGSRIAAGITAEIGSMAVTEQLDAIRALGADPVRKLVIPRVLACTVCMPLLTCFALVLGIVGALFVCNISFGISPAFFVTTAIDSVSMQDFLSGIGKTPFFGFLIAMIGCHFGLTTQGGTEGVGRATTSSVVVVSITLLVADVVLTQMFLSL
jgi:phospholipid/cholesterol/gamma-HCH transport system permease protein